MADPARLGVIHQRSTGEGWRMRPIVDEPVDAVDPVLGELPLPAYVTAEDVGFAVRAVVVHGPELWPAGPICRNCRVPYPCRLHRWGRRVLALWGLHEREIDELTARGDPQVVVRQPGEAR